MIRKLKSGQYRLYSRKVDAKTGRRRNLGTFPTRAKAERTRACGAVFQAARITPKGGNTCNQMLHEEGGQRTFAIVLQSGDEAMRCLQTFATEAQLGAAQLTAIGAFSRAKLAFFDWQTKKYLPIPIDEQVEVASLIGYVAVGPDGKASVHVHAVLGRHDGTAWAGHLLEGHVRPTLEIIATESPAHLRKLKDEQSGLALINIHA